MTTISKIDTYRTFNACLGDIATPEELGKLFESTIEAVIRMYAAQHGIRGAKGGKIHLVEERICRAMFDEKGNRRDAVETESETETATEPQTEPQGEAEPETATEPQAEPETATEAETVKPSKAEPKAPTINNSKQAAVAHIKDILPFSDSDMKEGRGGVLVYNGRQRLMKVTYSRRSGLYTVLARTSRLDKASVTWEASSNGAGYGQVKCNEYELGRVCDALSQI